MKNKLYHPVKGIIQPKEKKFNPLKGVEVVYADEKGAPHKLDGSEVSFDEVEQMLRQMKHEKMASELDNKLKELDSQIEEETDQEEQAKEKACEEEMMRKHKEVVETVKDASESITEAIKAIPETIVPEFPDHIDEQKKWKQEIIEAIQESKVEIPENDYSELKKAIEAIKFPEFPKPIDYMEALVSIKNALPKETDNSGVIEAIQAIKIPSLPVFEFNSEGRLKVEVDRVSLGGAGGGNGVADEITLKGSLKHYQTIDTQSSGTIDYTGKAKLDGTYLIYKSDNSNGSKRAANISNNPTHTSYIDAFNNRATLNYDYIFNLTNL